MVNKSLDLYIFFEERYTTTSHKISLPFELLFVIHQILQVSKAKPAEETVAISSHLPHMAVPLAQILNMINIAFRNICQMPFSSGWGRAFDLLKKKIIKNKSSPLSLGN
jgi:hypothetical protein